MRAGDIAPPALELDELSPGAPIATWPYRPVIALERLPDAAYVWDDTDPAVVWDADIITPAYATGIVSTPDAPELTPRPPVVFTVQFRAADWEVSYASLLYQSTTGQDSWGFYLQNGGVSMWQTANGSTRVYSNILTPAEITASGLLPLDGRDVIVTATLDVGGNPFRSRGAITADDGATWYTAPWRNMSSALTAFFDSNQPVRTGALPSGGRLYGADMRTGTNPTGGAVVWRFDAADYPGTGLSYVDPRGRTWTLSAAGAITPPERTPDAPYVWDAPFIGAGFTDAVCDFHAVDIDPGDADDLYLFPAIQCTVTLDNRAGTYTPWSADGRLVYWAPGRRLHVWVVDAQGEPWWLFSGRVASWILNADDTVTVTAFDGFAALAQELGGVWTPGVAGQTVQARYGAIVAAAAYPDPVDVEAGTVTLTAPELDADTSPLMALQRVALSDGGIVYADADGAIDYRARTWRAGRDDQAATWVVSDNVCTVPVVVWDAELAADDDRLATDVHLVNTADPPLVATAAATESVWAGDARYHLTHPDPDQWTTQLEGDDLAAYLIAQQSTPSMALSRFALYALDRQQPAVFDMVAGARRGDRVEVLHEYPDADGNPAILDTFAIALGVGHAITPESWVADVALSRTVDYRPVESWDWTRFTWDEDDPANVWRF